MLKVIGKTFLCQSIMHMYIKCNEIQSLATAMCKCVSIMLLQILICASMLTYMQDDAYIQRLQDMGDKMRKMEEKMKQIEEFESVNFYDKLEAFNRIHLMEQKLDEFDRRITNMHKECPRSQEDLAFKGIAINKKTTAKFNNTAFFWPLDAAAVGLFIVLNKFLFP